MNKFFLVVLAVLSVSTTAFKLRVREEDVIAVDDPTASVDDSAAVGFEGGFDEQMWEDYTKCLDDAFEDGDEDVDTEACEDLMPPMDMGPMDMGPMDMGPMDMGPPPKNDNKDPSMVDDLPSNIPEGEEGPPLDGTLPANGDDTLPVGGDDTLLFNDDGTLPVDTAARRMQHKRRIQTPRRVQNQMRRH
jgi:hypothetical protein